MIVSDAPKQYLVTVDNKECVWITDLHNITWKLYPQKFYLPYEENKATMTAELGKTRLASLYAPMTDITDEEIINILKQVEDESK